MLREYDEEFEAMSLDEAYLDITEMCRKRGMEGTEVGENRLGMVMVDVFECVLCRGLYLRILFYFIIFGMFVDRWLRMLYKSTFGCVCVVCVS